MSEERRRKETKYFPNHARSLADCEERGGWMLNADVYCESISVHKNICPRQNKASSASVPPSRDVRGPAAKWQTTLWGRGKREESEESEWQPHKPFNETKGEII